MKNLKPISYPETVFEGKASVLQPDDVKVDDTSGTVTARFGDYETLVRYDWKNSEVWGKCTCERYADLEPCEHIVTAFLNFAKHIPRSAVRDVGQAPDWFGEKKLKKEIEEKAKEAEKKLAENLKEKRRQEEQKKKAINAFEQAKARSEELKLIIKADELDEELAIKEYVEGTEPLVYRIQWKDKKGEKRERLVLSIRGWTQAMLYQGNIEIADVRFEEVGGKSIAKAIVRDTARNVTQIGIAERYTNDEFKWTTLASKAIRNALKKVISPAFEQRVIQEALEANLVIDLSLRELREVSEP